MFLDVWKGDPSWLVRDELVGPDSWKLVLGNGGNYIPDLFAYHPYHRTSNQAASPWQVKTLEKVFVVFCDAPDVLRWRGSE